MSNIIFSRYEEIYHHFHILIGDQCVLILYEFVHEKKGFVKVAKNLAKSEK